MCFTKVGGVYDQSMFEREEYEKRDENRGGLAVDGEGSCDCRKATRSPQRLQDISEKEQWMVSALPALIYIYIPSLSLTPATERTRLPCGLYPKIVQYLFVCDTQLRAG